MINNTYLVKIDGKTIKKISSKSWSLPRFFSYLFLFAVVTDEITENVSDEGGVKELFHAYDLMRLGDSWEKVEKK